MNIFQDRGSQRLGQKNYSKQNEDRQKIQTAAKNSKQNPKSQQEQNKSKQTQSLNSNVQSYSIKSQHNEKNKTHKKIKIGNNIKTQIDYGIFNQYRLDEFFNIENNIQQGQVIPVVTIESYALHLQQKFLNLMQKYNEYEISFVGVYGSKGCGKSLFLDKILNLATFQGSHFTQTKNPKSKKQICLWSVPLSRGKQRIFLVDCTGYGNDKQKQREDEMLCDFLLFLCSDIVLIQPHNGQNINNFVSEFISTLKSSMIRIHFNKVNASKESFFWPGIFSIAYRNQVRDDFKQLKKYFIRTDFKKLGDAKDPRVQGNLKSEQLKDILLQKYADRNKIMLNENYIKTASEYLLTFYQNCQPKFYKSIRPNGNGLSTILMNFVLGINCKEKVNIFSVIERTRKQILVESYNSTVNWYTRQLQKHLGKEQAKSTKELISIFQKVFYKSFTYFQKRIKCSLKIDPTDQQLSTQISQLQQKLQKYIRQKQLLIIKINEKKTSKVLKRQLDKKIDINQMPMQEILQLREILYRFKTIERHLDMNRLNIFKGKMIEGWNKFILNEEVKDNAEIDKLQAKLQTKRAQLKAITQRNLQAKTKIAQTMQKYNLLNRQSTELAANVQNIKFEINIHRKANLQKLENSYERIHLTARNQKQLINQLKQYEKKLQKSSLAKSDQLKLLREELQQAYRLQAQELKKVSLPNSIPLNSNNFQGNYNIPNLGKKTYSNYELPSKEKLDSLNQMPSLEEISFVNKQQQNDGINPLLKSRIAKNTESVRLLKYQIDEKVKTQQELQDKISNNFISFSRLTTEYRNNNIRGSQSRRVKVQNSNKKQKQIQSNDRQNDLQRKRLFQSGKKNNGASQHVKGIFANLI